MGYYSPTAIINIFEDVKTLDPDNFGGPGQLALGGVMGNSTHFAEGGYHVPRAYLDAHSPGDYSIQLPVDRKGNPDAASAIDLTPGTQDGQHLFARRLLAATDAHDPRLHPVREWASSLDSQHVKAESLRSAGHDGKEFVTDVSGQFDPSHDWHTHVSIDREWCDDTDAMAGVADVLAGVPLSGHNGGGGSTHHPDSGGQHRLGNGPKWPLRPGNWFGLVTGPRRSHGGATRRERRSIRRIQKRLVALGYGPLTVDGRFGPQTHAAVAAWQRKTRAAQTTRPGQVWADDWHVLLNTTSSSKEK